MGAREVDADYLTACSEVTLYSKTRGFFAGWANQLVALTETWLPTLQHGDDPANIKAVRDNVELMDGLNEVFSRISPLFRGKDVRESQQRRQAAAAALDAGHLAQALALASQAVLRAPMPEEEQVVEGGASLALALWTRAEVLLRAGFPRAALHSYNSAVKQRLGVRKRAHYYWRLGHCYKELNELTRAKVSYELAGRLLGAEEEAKAQLARDIDSLASLTEQKSSLVPLEDKIKYATVTGGAKQNMPALSKLVKIAEEENKGRFAVADSAIKTGDILLVDNPYAACLLPDNYSSYCLHCFKRLEDCSEEAAVWCPKCSGVAFCSVKCRDTALTTYHQYECQFLDLFIGSGMSILSHIALRMVTQAGLDTSLLIHGKYISNEIKTVEGTILNDIEGVAKKTKMKSRKDRLNRAKKGMKCLHDKNENRDVVEVDVETKTDCLNFEENLELRAAQVYALCFHSDKRRPEDFLKRIVMAMFLTECLKKAGFFKGNKDNLCKAESSICELLLRNLQLLQFNAHEIFETVRREHLFSNSKANYIAVGIYPTGALFNHECYPAVARYFEGRKIVLRAIRPLAPGEIVSENYGPHFLMRGCKDRQRSLACRYWFHCECIACRDDWPTLKQMKEDNPPYLRCPNMSCTSKIRGNIKYLPNKCPKCSTNIDKKLMKLNLETVQMSVDKFQEGARLMDSENVHNAIATISEAIDLYHEIGRPPYRELHLAQESLRSCFAATGNIHILRTDATNSKKETENRI